MGLYIKSHWDYCQQMDIDSPSGSKADEKLPTLTTTSYAILGFLNRQPMSAYELTQAMQNSLAGEFWARTRSKLFDEPKKLVAHGFATVEKETTGRKRAVYSVTDAGREALGNWIRQPTRVSDFEAEMILKVLAARTAEPQDILDLLQEQQSKAADYMELQLPVLKEWVDGGMRYPQDAHLSAVSVALMVGVRAAIREWTIWASEVFESWEDTQPSDEKTAWGAEVYRSILPYFEEVKEFREGKRDSVRPFGLEDLPKFPLTK